MNNPLRILQTLDGYLTAPAELCLFGRAALALGYSPHPAAFTATEDVDVILPLSWLSAGDGNLDFWEAQQRTNQRLEAEGLYLTHLFREIDVILRPDWYAHRVSIPASFDRLTVFRPATLDLILTKMARGDENDLADIGFLLNCERISASELRTAFALARVPDLSETHALFLAAQSKVLSLVGDCD